MSQVQASYAVDGASKMTEQPNFVSIAVNPRLVMCSFVDEGEMLIHCYKFTYEHAVTGTSPCTKCEQFLKRDKNAYK